jgi:3D-(3,5/4)-trihydroxycyclohexane-1,2-dione acylhydrolase (decyclizing)
MPGDLHKLWRTGALGSYHVESGYSCMGYEIAGGLGAKLAAPSREVFVLVDDGSYLMMAEVAELTETRTARSDYEKEKREQRWYL